MSGKITVGVLLLGAVALLVFALWFLHQSSPVDERFNFQRTPLAADTVGPMLLLEEVGDFKRLSFDPLQTAADGEQHGSAVYTDTDGKKVQFSVQGMAGNTPATLIPPTTPDDLFVKAHLDAQVPYYYVMRPVPGGVAYEFDWINGIWSFRAVTQEDDAERLLRFADGYPF